jgi:hypothetical protein
VSDSSAPSESSGTLYDPPEDASKADAEQSEENDVALRLSLPPDRAERLRAVAQQLGLTPSLVAKRAIELVCDEVVTIQDDNRPTSVLIQQYQARLDLLHSIGAPAENGRLEPPSDPS